MILARFIGGPAGGWSAEFARGPVYLRVTTAPTGRHDVLDQLEDDPAFDEQVSVYKLTGDLGTAIVCGRRSHPRSGHYSTVEYTHVPDFPDVDLADREAWRAAAQGMPA